LQELILTENFLKQLPATIGQLVKLTNLNVDRNALQTIPREIGKCGLIMLDHSISKGLLNGMDDINVLNIVAGHLNQLGVLSLRENRLHYLPSEVGLCKGLQVLDVAGNRYVNALLFWT
jgi:protein scribble